MEKLRKLPEHQKVWMSFNAGIAVAGLMSIGIATIHRMYDSERIEEIQEHNTQIEQELSHDFPGIGRLVLNPETDTFEFHVSREQSSLNCTGEYSVSENGEASVADDVTCSETIALGKN